MSFTHLHVHSQYSILDGAASIKGLVEKAKATEMSALAITDHGSMFGVKLFHDVCTKAGIKPILGVEAYVARVSRHSKTTAKIDRSGEHLIILAKNKQGYQNLIKLCSAGHTEGFYYRPRIDKELLSLYKEGLIIASACLGGEISQKIMNGDIEGAEKAASWYKKVFGEDYYLEVMRHPSGNPLKDADVYNNQVICNKEILRIGEKLGIKVIATNDVHFLNEDDAEAHDILLCLSTRKDIDDPARMRYTRQEWLKTPQEMETLFADIPEVLENTQEIVDKIENYKLNSEPIMPVFSIPESFGTEKEYRKTFSEEDLLQEFGEKLYNKQGYEKLLRIKFESDYLKYLTDKGAQERWGDNMTPEIRERLDFELQTIKNMGFPGYFLIVWNFIAVARRMGIIVGPGRGSAAGSAVAYCLRITDIDPVKYELLFERFLNPDRISMPDIDIDFDDEGRQKILDWVAGKYGQDKVAHIVTFGSMAAKMVIKDVARVLKLDLSEANRLAKMVPDTPKITLKDAYEQNPELLEERNSPNPLVQKTMQLAETLEGCVRQTGVHACGILISRDPLTDHIPVITTEKENLLTTQYDGHFVEPIGLLKMDFLGLRTLSIIKTCLNNIKISKNIEVTTEQISTLDDPATYELFARGETTGLFQFESTGMKKHLRALKPDRFEDLVAMNALYRPGPMEYIPKFIRRKHGQEAIEYDHPLMEPFLKETYGITVYQEQVMLQSRALGQFTRGMSDSLRKAMGKKKEEEMKPLEAEFAKGCLTNPEFVKGCEENQKEIKPLIEKIWKDWKEFAKYAFNKSHSVCYAYVAYQTGYLKTHYPAEFMAANLSNNLSQMEKIGVFMDECKRMGLNVLPPDVNESYNDFTVNAKGDIRFGMAAIKGVGEAAVEKIIEERKKNGPYADVFDFFERIDYRSVNKKALESLICAGGLDSFEYDRSQYFQATDGSTTMLDVLVNYGQKNQQDKQLSLNSLFGGMEGYEVTRPNIPHCEPWTDLERARKEKELIGIYLTSHPLDMYNLEINTFCTPLEEVSANQHSFKGKEITIAGIITEKKEGRTKKGHEYGTLKIEDFSGTFEIAFFGEDYIQYRNYFIQESMIWIKGKVQEKKWQKEEGELEFKVHAMNLLSTMGEKLIKSITLQVNALRIDNDTLQEVIQKFMYTKADEKNQDGLPVKIVLCDNYGNQVKMTSRSCKLKRSKELYEYFENNEYIKMKIN